MLDEQEAGQIVVDCIRAVSHFPNVDITGTRADLTIQVPVKNVAALKGFEFTSAYIRRWPLKRELLVDKDANGNLVGLALSKGPKDYSDSKFIIKVNDYFGPYIGYEWGRLPPNYELVDHKWTFGLLFKSKVKAK